MGIAVEGLLYHSYRPALSRKASSHTDIGAVPYPITCQNGILVVVELLFLQLYKRRYVLKPLHCRPSDDNVTYFIRLESRQDSLILFSLDINECIK
jgi:hypothetical protein